MPAAAYQPPAPTPKDTAWCNNITHMRIAAPRHCLCRYESSLPSLVALGRHGCAFVTVAGAAVSVSATAVSIAESAVETRPTSLPPAWMQSSAWMQLSAKVMKKTWITKTKSPRNSQVSAGCKRSSTAAKSRFNAFSSTGTSTFPENIDASSL